VLAAAIVLYAGTGHLIMARRPGNAIGVLLALIGLALAIEILTEQCPLYGLVTAPGSLPAPRVVGWLSIVVATVAIYLLLFLVLLFPDGRLPSRRWRRVRTGILVVMAATVVSQMQAGTSVSGGLTNVLDDAKASYPNPLGIFPRHGWFSGFVAAVAVAAIVVGALVVVSVFVRRRGASPERRKQLEWLGYVGAVALFWVVLLVIGAASGLGGSDPAVGAALWAVMILTPAVGIPVACVVAVLKYQLYDIDRMISRTVSYAVVTGLLVGLYAGLVCWRPCAARARLDHGRRGHADRGSAVQSGTAASPARGGPPVQPHPLRRRADDRRAGGPAPGRHRPGYGRDRPGRHRGPGAGARAPVPVARELTPVLSSAP
jgi:hypothetical protein